MEKTGKEPYDLETIRRLKKEAYEAGTPIPSVCNELSLKVLKNRFGEAERRVNLIFDGKHATFNLREYRFSDFTDGTQDTGGDGWTVYKGKAPFDK